MGNWYDIGFETNAKNIKEQAQRAKDRDLGNDRKRNTPRRFYLKRGTVDTPVNVIFLDETPFCLYEYNLVIDGKWGNYFTCLRSSTGKDPFAAYKDIIQMNRSYMGFLTILDCTHYSDRAGKEHHFTKKLLPMTSKALAKAEGWKKSKKSLVGCMYEVRRSDADKSERIGDDWQFSERVDLSTLKNPDGSSPDLTPANYKDILAPRSEEEIKTLLQSIVSGTTIVDLPTATATKETEEEVPF